MRLFLSLALVLIFSVTGSAAHILGGSITWERTSPNQYVFTLELIGDCNPLLASGQSTVSIVGPFGSIQLNLDTSLGGSYNLGNCYTGNCAAGAGFESLIYTSSPVTLSGPIPATGWEFFYSWCCYRTLTENTSSSAVYVSSIMYPNAQGGMPSQSTSHESTSVIGINGIGKESFDLGAYSIGTADSVVTILANPKTNANTPLIWSTGYSAQFPLPDATESPLNGAFYYNQRTGIASTDINDVQAMDKTYVLGVDHLFYSEGVLVAKIHKNIPVFSSPDTVNTPAPTLSVQEGSDTITYQRGMVPPSFRIAPGQNFSLTFRAVDVGDTLLCDVKSILLDTARSSAMGWSDFNNLNVTYVNSTNSATTAHYAEVQVQITADLDNYKEGRSVVNFRVQDFSCPNNVTIMPVELFFEPSVAIAKPSQSDTITYCPPFTDSIFASSFNNGAYWSPGSLVSDSAAPVITYNSSNSAWIYLKDTLANGIMDSIFIQPVLGSVTIGKGGSDLQLFDSVGLSTYTWRLNGLNFLSNSSTLTRPLNGVYDLFGEAQGCNYLTDTLNLLGGPFGLTFSPTNYAVLPNKQQLDSVYGMQFSVSNGNLVTENFRLNEVYLYGISSSLNKNSFSNATLKVFDANAVEIYSRRVPLQAASPSVVVSPQIILTEGQDYYLTVSSDSNSYYSMYQSPAVPYQIGGLTSLSGMVEVKGIYRGIDTSHVPNLGASKMPAMALSFTSTIGLSEQMETGFSVYPNPVQDWLEISLGNNGEKEFVLYNLQGQRLMHFKLSGGHERVDVSNLAKGAYLLKSGDRQVRFIKN
tara:strand:+ start:8027 stop:10453 length:2427 start_codon:yes stop_codon:yes gene_type:complete